MAIYKKLFFASSLFIVSCFPVHAGNYDGTWYFKVHSERSGVCSASSGQVEVKDGKISGNLRIAGLTERVFGKVADDGSFKGKIGTGRARFNGEFVSGAGVGKWKGRLGCKGTMSFNK